MYGYVIIILCYILGLTLLWIDPHDNVHKFVFYVCSSIPVAFFVYKMNKGKNRKIKYDFWSIVWGGIMFIAGLLVAFLTLTDFPQEYNSWFNIIFIVFVASVLIFIVRIRKRQRS